MSTIPLPPGVFPCGKFLWWRVIRLQDLDVIPPRSVLRDVAAELHFEACEDGGSISPGDARLCEWTGGSRRAVRGAIAYLVRTGLLHRDRTARSPGRGGGPGRAAEYCLTVREADIDMLIADGYDVILIDGGVRKYLHAHKRSAAQSAHDSGSGSDGSSEESSAAQSAHDSVMVCSDPMNGVQPRLHTPKKDILHETSSGSSSKSAGAPRRAQRPASWPAPQLEDITDEQRFAIVQRAAILRGWDASDVEYEPALAVFDHFIAGRKTPEPIADPVSYFYSPQNDRGIFASFDYFDGVLGVTGTHRAEW